MGGVINGISMEQRYNGALTQGAQNGSLNRQEFVALNAERNGINEMRAQFSEGGINKFEQAILNQRSERYEDQFQAYSQGDYHPGVRATNGAASRQVGQAGAIYDGLQNGSLSARESNQLLGEQRGIATQAGQYSHGGGINPLENWSLNHRLDRSADHIFEARHNWERQLPGWF